jgi:hypothetical protein
MSKHDLGKWMASHNGIGAIFGYAYLHPVSGVIHKLSEHAHVSLASFVSAFYWQQVHMRGFGQRLAAK